MRRLIAIVRWPVDVLLGHCSCDPRFVGVAHDVHCQQHGLAADLKGRLA